MTVSKLLTVSPGNLGIEGDSKVNPFVAQDTIVLTTDGFSFASPSEIATKSNWETGIKAGTVFPIKQLWDYEDNTVETTYAESGKQYRKGTRQGPRRFRYLFDLPLNEHKKLQGYRNQDLRVWIFDEDGNVKCTVVDGVYKGFSTSLINPEKMMTMTSDAGTIESSPLAIDYSDYKEWDKYGFSMEVSWLSKDLRGLTDVNLEVVSASSTEIVIRAYSDGGYNTSGIEQKVPIIGIASTVGGDIDWVDDVTGTVSGVTDNSDGTYTFAGTSFATGTIGLKAPSLMASTGLLIISTGDAAVTI